MNNNTLILVLDQFKQKNIDYEPSFSKTIEEYIQNKNLKVVFCLSLNDNEVRDKLLPTFMKFKGNPKELNKETQEFFFFIQSYIQKRNQIIYHIFYLKINQDMQVCLTKKNYLIV